MAPSHVPNSHLSQALQGQNIYTDPAYESQLFPGAAEQYSSGSWNPGQLNHHQPGLPAHASVSQPWQHNSYQHQTYNPISQPYRNTGHGYQTAPAYPYNQYGNQTALGSYGHPPAVDPALQVSVEPAMRQQQQQQPQQQAHYQIPVRNSTPQLQSSTVTSQALQQTSLQSAHPTGSPFQIPPKSTTDMFSQRTTPIATARPVSNPNYEMPQVRKSSEFWVFEQAALAAATKSSSLNKLVTFGSEPMHLPANRTALPLYTPRQSMRELKRAGADKKFAKKLSTKQLHAKLSARRVGQAGSPSSAVTGEVSDSETDTDSSDDDSEYTDDEDLEPSPLPATRPDEPHEAVRYDVIKAAWFPRHSPPSTEKIKTSMRELWDVLNTIQKRWRTDSKAVQEAEDQKKIGELPVLKSRVTSQRDLLQTALQSALQYSHPDVLRHMGQVKSLLYMCYQFLANRFKMQDYNGPLPSVIYEMLASCIGTLTTELIDETRVIKALVSMKKNANEKNKALIQQIIDGAATGSKKSKVTSPPAEAEATAPKVAKRPATQPIGRPASEGLGIKRLKPADPPTVPARKPVVAVSARPTNTSTSVPHKRPGERPAAVPVKARGNQVVNKPSTFFSSLNAASKKPTSAATGTITPKTSAQQKPAASVVKEKKPVTGSAAKSSFSFAQTMAELMKPKEEPVAPVKQEKQHPPETVEEKAKRERKESRRHLRVRFRPDATLVEVKLFTHDPDEELGHEENLVRDAGDIGGEGRMFKQHRDMDMEEDDDEMEIEYRPWVKSTPIDFSVVDPEERKRNYEPYGGGECKPTCPEKEANQRRENSTLMVFYTHPSDIPPTPREPPVETQAEAPKPVIEFGPPPQVVIDRSPKPAMPTAAPDLHALEKIFSQFAVPAPNASQPTTNQPSYMPPPPAAPVMPAVPDLSAILSALQNPMQPVAQAPVQTPAPAQQAPALDLNAILSAIQSSTGAGGGVAAFPPTMAGWPPFPASYPPQQQQGGATYQAQQQPQYEQATNGGTKRPRDDPKANNERGYSSFKKQKAQKFNYSAGNLPHKVLPCKFFKLGQCTKGDDCTYIHDPNM
ncbi:hypothetical protein BDV95DRAFT_488168 [Massariosphaeria phaeospora]|uniref:C3H1-type domain-containing protein n=1 Tax=Massariosphaeria phaeospora TaxID=100035 RepID=A0A7C8IEK6_9PLEO|nr:hypothetical protein BDV95DRAFT_488168 [Massariosphaeria phaeospora]